MRRKQNKLHEAQENDSNSENLMYRRSRGPLTFTIRWMQNDTKNEMKVQTRIEFKKANKTRLLKS